MHEAGIGHSDFMWYLRTRPAVKQAFQAVWNTTADMLVSFDGAVVFRDPGLDPSWQTMAGWWHVDQHYSRTDHSVQGLINLLPADASSGGIGFAVGSHKLHAEYSARVARAVEANLDAVEHTNEIMNLSPSDPVLQRCPLRWPLVQPGDLVLWSSRTVHAGMPAKPSGHNGLSRLAPLISMSPRTLANDSTLALRREAYNNGWTSTHLPHELILAHPTSLHWPQMSQSRPNKYDGGSLIN